MHSNINLAEKGKDNRVGWIDCLKALGIYLVILGHTLKDSYLSVWIYSFHMPLFFILFFSSTPLGGALFYAGSLYCTHLFQLAYDVKNKGKLNYHNHRLNPVCFLKALYDALQSA